MEFIHTTTGKTPEQIKTERIAAITARIMDFKSSHPVNDADGNPIQYDELDQLESLLAEAQAL